MRVIERQNKEPRSFLGVLASRFREGTALTYQLKPPHF